MESILNAYRDSINNAGPEKQIRYLLGEIHDDKEFIKLYEDEIKNTEDPAEIKECQNNIDSCHENIIKMTNLIEAIRKGEDRLIINISDIETNM